MRSVENDKGVKFWGLGVILGVVLIVGGLYLPSQVDAASCGSCSYRVCCHTSCTCCGGYDDTACENCDGDECCDGLGNCVRPGCSNSCECSSCSVSASCTCGGGGGGGGCKCDCDCSGLTQPSTPTLLSPANNATRVPTTNTVLDWQNVTNWGQDQKTCKNDKNDCACVPGESGLNDRRYEMYLSTIGATPQSLPSQSTPCPGGDARYTCYVPTSQYTVNGASKYYPLQPGTRYYWAVRAVNPGPGGSPGGNGVSCTVRSQWVVRSFVTNFPPEVISVLPNAGYSGTLTEDDNGPNCGDNNPMTFRVTYRDLDGCDHISSVYYWIDDTAPHVMELHSSMHGGIIKSGSTWSMYGLGYDPTRGETCGVLTGPDCYKNYDWDIYGGDSPQPSPGLCPGPSPDDNTDIYWWWPCGVPNSGTVGSWGSTVYACNGPNLVVDYDIRFYDDVMGNELDFYGYVVDGVGASSGWRDVGDWNLDFDHPSVSSTPLHYEIDNPDTVRFEQDADDSGVFDSGLDEILDRRYWIVEADGDRDPADGSFYSAGANVYNLSGVASWSEVYGPVSGIEGGDTIHTQISAVDVACNKTDADEETDEVGHQWIQTYWNSVYGWNGFNDPIQVAGEHLSSYWLGGGGNACATSNFFPGVGSLESPWWCTSSYDDENTMANNGPWFDELYRIAIESDWVMYSQNGEIPEETDPTLIQFGDSSERVVMYTNDEDDLVVTGSCSGRKVVFLGAGTRATISPSFTNAGNDDACILIGSDTSTIVVLGGSEAPDDVDDVEIAVVTDGLYVVNEDPVPPTYDRLLVEGFVFANTASFLRDLVYEYNVQYAAETIQYDPRYLDALRDMLGRRHYVDFECGLVTNSSLCEGW